MGDSWSHTETGQRHSEKPKEAESDLGALVSVSPLWPRSCTRVFLHVCSLAPVLARDISCGGTSAPECWDNVACVHPPLHQGGLWASRLSGGQVSNCGQGPRGASCLLVEKDSTHTHTYAQILQLCRDSKQIHVIRSNWGVLWIGWSGKVTPGGR